MWKPKTAIKTSSLRVGMRLRCVHLNAEQLRWPHYTVGNIYFVVRKKGGVHLSDNHIGHLHRWHEAPLNAAFEVVYD